jgi:Putative peptidoglycan binding domain
MSWTRNTFPISWNGLRRMLGVFVIVFTSACTATDRPRSSLSDARISGGTIRPALDRILSAGEISVAEAHVHDFGYDPGPVDGLFTAQTQVAVRAFQARYGLPVSGLLDRETRQELLPGLDQDEFDP